MRTIPIPVLSDNYTYLIIDETTGASALVDCPDAKPALRRVEAERAQLRAVLCTHHHWDHVGANADLRAAVPDLAVYGSATEGARIPELTHPLAEGDEVAIGRSVARVLSIPAHTRGHIAYFFPDDLSVFCGDTLFVGGCGRVFEGTAAEMVSSLRKLMALPDETKVYCGHEYTETNLRFALTLEPNNGALRAKYDRVTSARAAEKPTVPSTIAEERATNPFLRLDSPELQESLRRTHPDLADDPVAVFAAARTLKDAF